MADTGGKTFESFGSTYNLPDTGSSTHTVLNVPPKLFVARLASLNAGIAKNKTKALQRGIIMEAFRKLLELQGVSPSGNARHIRDVSISLGTLKGKRVVTNLALPLLGADRGSSGREI